ncbi:MAG TPA: FtsX-like permease family protein [Gemmatimonadaceae bacterium]|nr:FtsX-like permease family protein [Gemmatimonadaceae bacterium]
MRGALVVSEIALSLSFLIAAALLIRSFIALERTPIGYDPRGLVAAQVRLAHEPPAPARVAWERDIARALRAAPSVAEVAIGPQPQTEVRMGPFAIDGSAGPETVDLSICEMPFVEPSYFGVARIALVEGRTFGSLTDAGTSQELIVNQSLARRLWPNRNPLGARLRVGDGAKGKWLTVVGVAHDLHLVGTSGDLFNLQMYRPVSADADFERTMLVRARGARGSLAALEPSLARAVEQAGVGATLERVVSIESTIDNRVLARPRRALVVFAMFAIVALALSAAGLYGVIAYAVAQRTREIGVRVALGADPAAVARLILGDSGRLVAAGGALGLLIAYVATRAVSAFLYAVAPTDPMAFLGATLLLFVVALVAAVAPMRRALRIDPCEALRAD